MTCGLVRSNLPFAIFFDSEKSNDHYRNDGAATQSAPLTVVPMAGIGPATSPLPRECSTTEPHGRNSCRLASSMSFVERETGIEPASLAWKAKVLPLNYSRVGVFDGFSAHPTRGAADGHHSPLLTTNYRLTHSPSFPLNFCGKPGGGGWIRTSVGVSQQIYSLPPLATRAPLRRTSDYSTVPTHLRPADLRQDAPVLRGA